MSKNFNAFKIAWETAYMVAKNRNILNAIKARQNAKINTREFYKNLENKYWIKVEYKFWDNSLEKFPEIVEAIEKYIYEGINNDIIPKLFIWNHQAFWLEALWAYDYFSIDWKIVLKDDLIKPPFFGDWIKSIDPIIHYRNDKDLEDKRIEKIKKQVLENKAVLIYPEWTRSKNWKLRWFQRKLYKPAYDIISDSSNEISSKVAIITSDTFNVLPNTLENSLLFMWELNPWNITYTIDIVDASLYENIKIFNNYAMNIIKWNLI